MDGKRRLIRGEGFATRISNNVRPQDPGGGTANGQNMDEFYQRVVSSDEEDFGDLDDGSVADLEMDTWAEACSSASQNAFGTFPLEAAHRRPAVIFSNHLFSGEELADMVFSV